MIQCETENHSGVRCPFGAGHAAPHDFRPLRLTEAQWRMLEESPLSGWRQWSVATRDVYATAKALQRRGLVRVRYVGSRMLDTTRTLRGEQVWMERPR